MNWLNLLLVLPFTSLTVTQDQLYCQQGYTGLQNSQKCYRLFTSPVSNYADARVLCQKDGADLVSIHDAFEDNFVRSLSSSKLFIGLQYYETPDAYQWSDGTPLDYTNYAPNFEAYKDYYGYCAAFDGPKWNNAECEDDKLPFVCKKAAANYNVTSPNVCPNSSIYYLDGGALFSPGYPKNFAVGLHCYYRLIAKNGYVIKLFLNSINYTYGYDVFYVLNNYDASRYMLMLYPTQATGWEITLRTNRVALDFVSRSGGIWRIDWIELKESMVKSAGHTTSNDDSPDVNYACRNGYALHETKCYLVVSNIHLNYFEAMEYCRDIGADLASIHYEHADKFLHSLISGIGEALIGLLYRGNNIWAWSDGTPVDYTNYDETFVPLVEYLGYCVKLFGGQWHNAECNDELSFICEKRALNYTPTATNVCPNASIVYMTSGLLVSPGYPLKYAGLKTHCYYELVVKNKHFIKLQVDEMKTPSSDFFNIYYYRNGEWPLAGLAAFYNETEGAEFIIPHNRIKLEFLASGSGYWRLNWEEVANPGP